MKYFLGVDIGTTALKAALFDENLRLVKSLKKEYELENNGKIVEFSAEKYWEMLQEVLKNVQSEYTVYAMSIDTQCETLILADEYGQPLEKAVVWLDNRATEQAKKIKNRFGEKRVYEVTGQPEITATWPACKLLWFCEERKDVFAKLGKIFMLEDWLLFKLTGRFITEETLQSSTIYYDIVHHCWWKEMLDFIGVPVSELPEVRKSGEYIGDYEGIKVVAGAMDQIAGAIGVGATEEGVVSEMTGTTMAIFANTDDVPAYDENKRIPCHLSYDGGYALLSWTATAGIALKWFKNNFCEGNSFAELDRLASGVPSGCDGLTFLPYLCGATIPRFDPEAKGGFYGFTLKHTRAHAVRSMLESIAFMLKGNLDYLGVPYDEVRSTGGGAQSDLWCQIKADVVGKQIVTVRNEETACLGSAILAGVGSGVFANVAQAVRTALQTGKRYAPSGVNYDEYYERYRKLSATLLREGERNDQ